jgi:hypothetical protein
VTRRLVCEEELRRENESARNNGALLLADRPGRVSGL